MQSTNSIEVTKKILYTYDIFTSQGFQARLKYDSENYTIPEFLKFCEPQQKKSKKLREKVIKIVPTENNIPIFKEMDNATHKGIKRTQDLSFQIMDEDIQRIANDIISILRDPMVVAELLKDLDKELGIKMQENNIQFNDKDLPEFIIAGLTHYIPGPPPDNYFPKNKEGWLDKILLKRENLENINMEGITPKFSGFIDENNANPFVVSGHLFTEDKQVSRILLHGSYTHRIIFEVIRSAIKNGKLNVTYGNNNILTMLQILELFVYTEFFAEKNLRKFKMSLWLAINDTVGDSTHTGKDHGEYLDPNNYVFSCRSPFVLQSLLINFGKELGLPHLQFYLLDSFYKAAFEMVYRIKDAANPSMLDSDIYIYCMQALSVGILNASELGILFPFTIIKNADSSFKPFDEMNPIPGIVKKVKQTEGNKSSNYKSWADFFAKQSQKSNSETPSETLKINKQNMFSQ